MKTRPTLAAALGLAALALPASAQDDCTFDGAVGDFDQPRIEALYACIADDLARGYAREGDAVGSVYRDWRVTATAPAAPGPHGTRALLTFANDTAFAPYVLYREDGGFTMPEGSVLAKESFSVDKKGKPRKGPLFVMTKVAPGAAADYGDWVYAAVQPNGKEMKITQAFCHDCHAAFDAQDSMGYPDPDVRLAK